MIKNKCKKIITVTILLAMMATMFSINVFAGGASSSMNIEKFLLNNPVDNNWVRQADQIRDIFYTNPYRYFEHDELKYLIQKTEDAMHRYNSDCVYSYNTLVKIRDAFDNARIVRMRG